MRVRATASSLLIATLLCLSAAIPAAALQQNQQPEWTWKDCDGNVRSRADLDEILRQHKLWVQSKEKSGFRANLSHADLRGAGLNRANLNGTFRDDTDQFDGAELVSVVLSDADLSDAGLRDADLNGAHLARANLRGAYLWDVDLIGAYLEGAHLSGAIFEPKSLPTSVSIAYADGLELMTYRSNPSALTQLRKQFQDAGYREQERAITCALNRRQAELDPFIDRWFKRVAFDLTCQYGFSPGRPLRIVGLLWLLFSIVYAVFMHGPGKSGIYLVGTRLWRGKSNTQAIQIRPRALPAAKWWKLPFLWLRREWRVLRAAMFFSLMSAFNIGFRDINFGRWLRLLTKREYDLKAVGWARTVSGFQSLLSVYLIALWVLSYFGRPFG